MPSRPLLIALAGAGIFWFVRAQQVSVAERNVVMHARFVEESILRTELKPGDFTVPAGGGTHRRLDALFEKRVLIDGGLRVKLYGRTGSSSTPTITA